MKRTSLMLSYIETSKWLGVKDCPGSGLIPEPGHICLLLWRDGHGIYLVPAYDDGVGLAHAAGRVARLAGRRRLAEQPGDDLPTRRLVARVDAGDPADATAL